MRKVSNKCQVFTPPDIVEHMLDKIEYRDNLIGKKVLENSCGDGNFLVAIVTRYIQDCKRRYIPLPRIRAGLEQDICGFELDLQHYNNCIENLNKIAKRFDLEEVRWNVQCSDALVNTQAVSYQFVIGNPPYIAYQELDLDTRKYIRNNFQSCSKGKPDYYYAFIESALNSLAPNGKLIYLVPSNFLKNKFSDILRKTMLPLLYEIEDYTVKKLFEKRLTSSSIIICDSAISSDIFYYKDVNNNHIIPVQKNSLNGKWNLTENSNLCKDELVRFGDCFTASAPIATQLNEAFVIKEWIDDEQGLCIRCDNHIIEKTILRNAASPKAFQSERDVRIIFPYYYNKIGLQHYNEENLKLLFPGAYTYLLQYKDKLLSRKSDKNANWFEFGRSQLLTHINQRKLIMSTLITNKVRIYELDTNTIPYTGICIIPKANYTVTQALCILNNPDFMSYIKTIGINANGTSYRISPSDVNEYRFKIDQLGEN